MTVRRSFLPTLLVSLLLLFPRGARAGSLTLEQAVKQALSNHERAGKAPLRVKAAEGQLDRARSSFLPSLVAGANATLRGTEDRIGRQLFGTGTVTLTQPILNPSAIPQYTQARRQLAAERWGAVEDRRSLAFDTARAFLVVLTRERVLEAATRRLERARANQQNADARAQAGLASTNDVTRALLETAAAAREVAQAEGNVATAYLELGFLVGSPVTGPLSAPDRTTRAAESGGVRGEDEVRQAEARRPDLRAAEERTAALRASAQEPLYRLAPTLTLSAQVRFNPAPAPPDTTHDETLQLNLTWPIFDAGARYGDRKTRVAQAESQALDERQIRRSVATDIGIARATLKAARDSYRIAEEAVAAARKNTTETEILYQQGLARAIELVDANARRFEAEVALATAKLAMEQAYLELRFALGQGPTDDDTERSAATNGGAQ
ncbi:TolC family protein [Polyangium sp. 15x6]|uniref:TolC family protein n=1 Tax=Polyangium sp. 15x6 TaxID=3042687 RepID=UPI00249CF467|nr:TolC family protein [Polyangium sp. 15x6]MDI3283826.1 TolC family protein [Polyangium sp. 15x6]